MENVTERRTSLETAHQKSKNMLVQEQTEQMQRLELMGELQSLLATCSRPATPS